MTEETERFIKLAKENRRKFLEGKRQEFESTNEPKKRAKIVIELLKLEPSHLDERWIYSEIIKWMRDKNSVYYLKKAFIYETGRDRMTEIERARIANDFFTYDDVLRISSEEAKSIDASIWVLSDRNSDSEIDAYTKIKKRYYRHLKRSKWARLPIPYWGLDIFEEKRNGKTVIIARLFDMKIGIGENRGFESVTLIIG